MPDDPDMWTDDEGSIWMIDRNLTRWEKVEHPAYPDGVTPAQVPVQVLHVPTKE